MTKQELVAHFIHQLEQDLAAAKEAARSSRDAATNEESKPENQYDTRALEASYLAGAQAHRVVQINEVLVTLQTMKIIDFGERDTIKASALTTIRMDGKTSRLFVLPKGGGVNLKLDGETIQIVTPSSNLGEAILGLKAGEVAEFEVGDQLKECEILKVQ